MGVRLAFAPFTVGEAAHRGRLPQTQAHSALQTLSLYDVDLKLGLTGVTPAAEAPTVEQLLQCCAGKIHPPQCNALLLFYLKVSHPQAVLWTAHLSCSGATTGTKPG